MKKILFFIVLFLFNISTILAEGFATTDQFVTCAYKTGNEYIIIHLDASNLQSAELAYYPRKVQHYLENSGEKEYKFDGYFDDYRYKFSNYKYNEQLKLSLINALMKNDNKAYEDALTLAEQYNYSIQNTYLQNKNQLDVFSNDIKKDLICPSSIFLVEDDKNNHSIFGCGNKKINGTEVSTCSYMEKAVDEYNKDHIKGEMRKIPFYASYEFRVEKYEDEEEKVAQVGKEWKDKIDKYCNEKSATYDKDECDKARIGYDSLLDDAEDYGMDQSQVEEAIEKLKVELDFDVSGGCKSYLGNPHDKVNKPPAYYLQFLFNLIKYASIICLFVYTIADFFKAVTSGKDDALKKAGINASKRLVIVIIIFFLPMFIEAILKMLGIYSASTCGIS